MKASTFPAAIDTETYYLPVGVDIRHLRTLRIKVTDRCSWNCVFCHNEGTGKRNPKKVLDIFWNTEIEAVLKKLKTALSLNEVHLTGGEPTLNSGLPELVRGLSSLGMKAKMTSIGADEETIEQLALSGLSGVNFSLHSLSAVDLTRIQLNRSLAWSEKNLAKQVKSTLLAKRLGLEVKVNTVISGMNDVPRVEEVVLWCQENEVPMRVMIDLGKVSESMEAAVFLFSRLGAIEKRRYLVVASSSVRSEYELPNGYELSFKYIRPLHLGSMCNSCQLKNNGCSEKYYGVRLEKRWTSQNPSRFFVRLCVHKTDGSTVMPLESFLVSSQLADIQSMLLGKVELLPRNELMSLMNKPLAQTAFVR